MADPDEPTPEQLAAHIREQRLRWRRSHGSPLGAKRRSFCDGTKFQYAFH
jgi:hypothetical protein